MAEHKITKNLEKKNDGKVLTITECNEYSKTYMQKGDYKTEHLELPWSYLKVYTEERHCTISFLQDQDVVRKISDMTRVWKWSCESSYYKLWKIMYMKQSALYHYAIFGCLSNFYKSSLKLDSNTLKSLKKRIRFLSHTHTHTFTVHQ